MRKHLPYGSSIRVMLLEGDSPGVAVACFFGLSLPDALADEVFRRGALLRGVIRAQSCSVVCVYGAYFLEG